MAVDLSNVRERDAEYVLTVVESVEHNGKRLAVCETSDGTLVLARERERGVKGKDGKRSREHGTEKDWTRTARLADFRDALASSLIA